MIGRPRTDPAIRIAKNTTPTPSGCLLWTGAKYKDGYGCIGVGRGTALRVHRVTWELEHGPIPPGRLVCHKCDNPLCVNLEHLFLGSPLDNMRDMIQKGRHAQLAGERHPSCKLTDAQVKEIRSLRTEGRKLNDIAAMFNISFQHVLCVARRRVRA